MSKEETVSKCLYVLWSTWYKGGRKLVHSLIKQMVERYVRIKIGMTPTEEVSQQTCWLSRTLLECLSHPATGNGSFRQVPTSMKRNPYSKMTSLELNAFSSKRKPIRMNVKGNEYITKPSKNLLNLSWKDWSRCTVRHRLIATYLF